ncbi:unnamed protein product [Larinioides sclopetarius]|uniref:Uncharacterized protein n=1 Tax=Larinioides sclopetarius TaxID=280406 RepID=A0AAV1YQS7_9ARAC
MQTNLGRWQLLIFSTGTLVGYYWWIILCGHLQLPFLLLYVVSSQCRDIANSRPDLTEDELHIVLPSKVQGSNTSDVSLIPVQT